MAVPGPRGPADEISQRLWTQYAKRAAGSLRLEHEPHHQDVPKLAVLPPVVEAEPSFLLESELPVEGDRRVVPGEHLQAQLMNAGFARPVHTGLHQRGAHTLPAPRSRDAHADCRGTRAAPEDSQVPDDLVAYRGDKATCVVGLEPLEELLPSVLPVDRRLREDMAPLGRDLFE